MHPFSIAAPLIATRDERLWVALRIVQQVTWSIAPQATGQFRDDIASFGAAAIPSLLARHDASRAPFEPYAVQRVRWAIIDGIRRERRQRPENVLSLSHALRPRTHERACDGDASDEDTEYAPEALTSNDDPEQALEQRQLDSAVDAALCQLSPPAHEVVTAYYFRGEKLELIASRLGMSKSTACRLHTSSLARIGRHLQACGHITSARGATRGARRSGRGCAAHPIAQAR